MYGTYRDRNVDIMYDRKIRYTTALSISIYRKIDIRPHSEFMVNARFTVYIRQYDFLTLTMLSSSYIL